MPNNYILLETIALTQSAASVTFDNLPTSGYTDLKIVLSVRSLSGSNTTAVAMDMLINGVSTNRSARRIFGVGSSAGSDSPSGARLGSAISTNTATASTFSSLEIYFPNYRSSNNKSFSVDSVTENNSTSLWEIDLTAGLWSSSAAITSFAFSNSDSSSFAAGSTFSLYGIAALGTTPVLAPKATGGNIVANDGTYWYHAFTSSGNFVPQVGLTADCLVIAGGGGGSIGGGGAGGLRAFTSQSLTTTNYAVTIGAGGAGQRGDIGQGSDGVASTFQTLTSATGGGGAGDRVNTTTRNGRSGGSGGGAGYNFGPGTGGAASPSGQGNAGASAAQDLYAGGGGGAGAVGTGTTTNASGGNGSSSYSSWGIATNTGQDVSGTRWYAGGGGGLLQGTSTGGNGGGAAGVYSGAGIAGTTNTGGGGGGAVGGGAGTEAGAGGSGIVIVRYPIN
jgi:hypothetical protein